MNQLSSKSERINKKVMTVLQNIRAQQSNGLPHNNWTNLSEAGFTSLEMVQVMLDVESAFDLMIPQRYITPENFATAASITTMICELTKNR